MKIEIEKLVLQPCDCCNCQWLEHCIKEKIGHLDDEKKIFAVLEAVCEQWCKPETQKDICVDFTPLSEDLYVYLKELEYEIALQDRFEDYENILNELEENNANDRLTGNKF